MPLAHCQRKDDATQCKSFFPRSSWVVDRVVALCRGVLGARDVPRAGGRGVTGCFRGPMNEESLDGTLPATFSGSAGLNLNGGPQIPRRV